MSSETCVWQGILESNWNKTHQSNLLYYLLFPDFFPDDAEKSLKNLGSDKMPGKKGQLNMLVKITIPIFLFVQDQVNLY